MPTISIASFLFYFLAAALQGFALSSIIIFRPPRKKPGVLLGILLFLFSLSLLNLVLEETIHMFHAKFPVPMNYGLAYGPLAYYHIKGIVNPSLKFNFRAIVHFIPSLLIDFLFSLTTATYVRANMQWAYANIATLQLVFLLIGLLTFLHMLAYTHSFRKVIRKAGFKSNEIAKATTGWLKTFTIFWLLLVVFLGITILLAVLNPEQLDDGFKVHYPVYGFASICIYWLGYRYLLKYGGGIQKYLHRMDNIKYSLSEITARKKQLLQVLEIKELYKDEKLNLEGLARELGWSPRDVSLVIKEAFGTNFNNLINNHRINAFKVLVALPENQKYSMEGLAQDVGFNSKASFYRAFKKICHQTPGEFLEQTGLK